MIFKRNGFKEGLSKASFAIGNVLSLLFVILLLASTNVSQKPAGILCSAASVLVVLGQFIITLAYITKIGISLILKNMNAVSKLSTKLAKQQPRRNGPTTLSNLTRDMKLEIQKSTQMYWLTTVLVVLVISIIAIIWFSLEPLTVHEIQLGQSHSQNHRSIVNVYFTEACQLSLNSLTSKILFAIIMLVYGILQLRLIQLLVFARKIGSNVMADIVYAKIAIGVSTSVIFLGGIVIWLFYSANPSALFIAVSAIDLMITATNTVFMLKSFINDMTSRITG